MKTIHDLKLEYYWTILTDEIDEKMETIRRENYWEEWNICREMIALHIIAKDWDINYTELVNYWAFGEEPD